MRIDKFEIKGFGKFNNRTFALDRGINMIYGPNEAGKTTLQWFIRSMLYGLKNGRQSGGGFTQGLKRFEPWMGGQYGGAMSYTLDNGSKYRVERDFLSGSVSIFDGSYNDITGTFSIDRDKQPMFAQKHLGMDESTFERTVLIRQRGIRLDENDSAALAACLANVSTTGLEDVSLAKAEKALNDALKNNIGTERTRSQPLDKLEARLKQLESEYAGAKELLEQKSSTRDELQKVRTLKVNMNAKKDYLKKLRDLVELRKELDINLKRESELKRTAREIKERRMLFSPCGTTDDGQCKNARENNRRSYKPSVLCFSAMLIFLALFVYMTLTDISVNLWPIAAACCLGAVLACVAGILALRKGNRAGTCKNTKQEQTTIGIIASSGSIDNEYGQAANEAAVIDELKSIKDKLNKLSKYLEDGINDAVALAESLEDTEHNIETLSQSLKGGIFNAAGLITCFDEKDRNNSSAGSGCKEYFKLDDLEANFYDLSIEELERAWQYESENVNNRLNNAALMEKYLEGVLTNRDDDGDRLQRLEEETIAVKEKISYLKYKGSALRLAKEVLLEAGLVIRNTYAPDLDSRLCAIVSGLTDGRYNDLRGNDRLSMRVAVPENGDIKAVGSLSGATEDQMYLALRLAMADMLTDGRESLPLIMDEAFSQFDDKRTRSTIEYLHNEYRDRQILIFTCKSREVDIARDICGESINYMEL
jgi:uncharacterized protein YhaN